ncbi:MAG: phosphate ABC transporter ATP-binding protein [Armatimonadetes bacterium]|nr:phosphate ABC transporter ATP-binding protein [Armatimonadota bacterium]
MNTLTAEQERLRPAQKARPLIRTRNLSLGFGSGYVLQNLNLSFKERRVTALIGPSGSGKSTLLRAINRTNDGLPGYRIEGQILFDRVDIYDRAVDVCGLRQRVGMVFQKPVVFHKSIYENVLFGIKHLRLHSKREYPDIVEAQLRAASLWEEVKDRLSQPATRLSIGQQQRLCLARAMAVSPEVLLMDEPTSALDPKSTAAIEELILDLKGRMTVLLATHNLRQARSISDKTIFICNGCVVEQRDTEEFFTRPGHDATREYIQWNACDCD